MKNWIVIQHKLRQNTLSHVREVVFLISKAKDPIQSRQQIKDTKVRRAKCRYSLYIYIYVYNTC